jgi:hypothetical protein
VAKLPTSGRVTPGNRIAAVNASNAVSATAK